MEKILFKLKFSLPQLKKHHNLMKSFATFPHEKKVTVWFNPKIDSHQKKRFFTCFLRNGKHIEIYAIYMKCALSKAVHYI